MGFRVSNGILLFTSATAIYRKESLWAWRRAFLFSQSGASPFIVVLPCFYCRCCWFIHSLFIFHCLLSLTTQVIASVTNPRSLDITDGNFEAVSLISLPSLTPFCKVEHCKNLVRAHEDLFGSTNVEVRQLIWGKQCSHLERWYDIIVLADCCYFVDVQEDLLSTLLSLARGKDIITTGWFGRSQNR